MTQMLGMRLVTRRRGGLMADRSTIAISYYRFRVVESPSNGYTLRWSVVGYLTSKKGSCQDTPLGIISEKCSALAKKYKIGGNVLFGCIFYMHLHAFTAFFTCIYKNKMRMHHIKYVFL